MSSPTLPSVGRAGTIAGGGKKSAAEEPELKRRRRLDAGGPIEDDETARQKMRDAQVYERGVDRTYRDWVGFDPDNVADVKSIHPVDADRPGNNAIKPMGHFAEKGDLSMMRWLYVNGADTRDVDVATYFPMYCAALMGRMEACKWLFQHGAAEDIKRKTPARLTPLGVSFGESRRRHLGRWLILKGALCKDGDTGDLDVDLMKSSLNRINANSADGDDVPLAVLAGRIHSARERPELLKWAREHHQARFSFKIFMMGTLSKPQYSATKLRNELLARNRSGKAVDRLLECVPPDQYHLLWADLFTHRVCPLAVFAGKSGVLELIGDYVGIKRGREAYIVRQLTEILPGVIMELEDRETDSDESSEDGDY